MTTKAGGPQEELVPQTGGRQPRSFSDVVYESIFSMILQGAFSPSRKLPTELALSQQFKVSRPVVRSALARLRDDGLIVSRQGSGSYVVRQPDTTILSFTPLSGISDMQRCFEFRVGFEGEAACMAAARRGDEELASIRATLEGLEEAVSHHVLGVENDYQFHLSICQACDNRFYVGVMRSLESIIKAGMNVTRNLSLLLPNQRLQVVQEEHRVIYQAIANADGPMARRAMRDHLMNAKRRVFGE